MPIRCVEGREVIAGFDGGMMTSDAGALLLGAADRVIGLTRGVAVCFRDARNPALIEHEVAALVGRKRRAIPTLLSSREL